MPMVAYAEALQVIRQIHSNVDHLMTEPFRQNCTDKMPARVSTM